VRLAAGRFTRQAPGGVSGWCLWYFTTSRYTAGLDLEIGRWLYRNPRAPWLSGVACVVEFHYTTTLQDADSVTAIVGLDSLTFGNSANRMDVPNLTVGLHGEIADRTLLRVGGVFPLDDDADDRFFDAELQVQVERRF